MNDITFPMVSVICLAYNHAAYIADALDGFLMQEADFPFEVVVHDDASTDGTSNIIRRYSEMAPNIIRPILQTENKMQAGVDVLGSLQVSASGKYIALCEGDDYWTDPHKLQKQVSFLESHPEYTMCCSHARASRSEVLSEIPFADVVTESRPVSCAEVIYYGGLFIPTATVVYRKDALKGYPQFCRECWVGDYPLQIYLSVIGKVFYFNEAMAVYCVSTAGSWTERMGRRSFFEKRLGIESELRMLNGINELTDFKLNRIILLRKMNWLGKDAYKCLPLVLSGRWYNTFIFHIVTACRRIRSTGIAGKVMRRIAPYFWARHRP